MEKTFTVQDQFSETVSRYVSREMGKGKDPRRAMSRIMVDWLFQAMKAAPPEDADEIVLYLMGLVRLNTPKTSRKRAAVVNEMRDTLALLIVRKINYKGARTANTADASKIAKKYVNARRFSAGFLKSGFHPALRELRKSSPDKYPRYKKHPPGELIPFTMTPNEITLAASNFATFIAERYPHAFEQGAATVNARFSQYLLDDMIAEQNAAGLNAKSA